MTDVRAGVAGGFVEAQGRNGARNIGAELAPQLIGVDVAGIGATRREGIPQIIWLPLDYGLSDSVTVTVCGLFMALGSLIVIVSL
jgi:hypothetical protein